MQQRVELGEFFRVLAEAGGERRRIENPIGVMFERMSCETPYQVQRYLRELQQRGLVQNEYGGLEGKDIVATSIVGDRTHASEPNGLVQEAQKPVQEQKTNIGARVVLLVDVDNTIMTAAEAGLPFSFSRLLEYARKFGNVDFAFAFLSPSSTRLTTVKLLSDLGFYPIACPLGPKDKDSVDMKIKLLALQFLGFYPIQCLVIVSRDADFQDIVSLGANRHKEVILLDILKDPKAFEGVDAAVKLFESQRKRNFRRVLEILTGGAFPGLPESEDKERCRFLLGVLRAAAEVFVRHPTKVWAFKELQEEIWREIFRRWGKIFSPDDLNAALSILVDAEILKKNFGSSVTYYTLDENEPLLQQEIN